MSFKLVSNNENIQYYIIESFQKSNKVEHLFSTRIGWDNENFSKQISKIFDVEEDNIIFSKQVHGTNIGYVQNIEEYKNKVYPKGVDGLITDRKDIVLVTYYADCVPLFFLDIEKEIIALAHSGWKGTVKNIGGKMVDLMMKKFNSAPENILVGIGPSIGSCCYEVGKDVYNEFKERHSFYEQLFIPIKDNKFYLDLWKANKTLLEDKGIPSENITVSNICTSCNNQKLYSYRKENGTKNRMISAIKLKG
ncbi:peptidoglycan editing factor PgeF [Anaerosalibacter bizertensis]|uniref:Purine nucleoside phosphorylase n=1 Tax=Anaerosalibacter bizertensis TaxID=932217 RepID=A0A9Q4ABU0_9FIRM|nr:peptidoglycan editing factor PgeF [Anaerosalibacter bizertensis]MBV1817814.1 peptidoglycan editing factor PgeF [Bacteroidales bacterium MSK.15.36]MCG4564524.1 peptidoglycan editing factor PgeF [Anaerosalibacter bizertensis]MCG4581414.1 peptidoglycan editing factor PgeF [Anaerosalibacter bizertensis]